MLFCMTTPSSTLLSYPGILVEVWVPRTFDERKLIAALNKMKTDIKASGKKHLPPGVKIRTGEIY
jgi:hypothetical protein